MRLPILAACVSARLGLVASIRLGALQVPQAEQEALQRIAAVEDVRQSHILCRVGDEDDSVTVRLHKDNSRSLAFNNDVNGFETKVKCRGEPDPSCLAESQTRFVSSVDECPKCPCAGAEGELFGPYSRMMAAEVEARCSRSDGVPPRILQLGLGCGEIAAHLASRCEGLQMEAVELDSRLPPLAKLYFGLPGTVQVTVGDAGPVAQGLASGLAEGGLAADDRRYDVVLADCFSTGGVTPEHCRSSEFVHNLHTLLRSGGRVIHHLWHEDPQHAEVASEFQATVELYKKEYACPGCQMEVRPVGADAVDDLVVASVPADSATGI